ncbi:hypothetical protein [Calycomorphotria hydatis]|uniref:Uncharacterized protein n=1 Tax=Calycomorphotria hydatis TaxID=2528027 RepID=A0A517T9M1_9PLAN|nr:hypothetical protein [Calycomorphotria hydatis]QDT65073.1 hypothetical protein V22_23190 [Calycomorphotria hydatis]
MTYTTYVLLLHILVFSSVTLVTTISLLVEKRRKELHNVARAISHLVRAWCRKHFTEKIDSQLPGATSAHLSTADLHGFARSQSA